MKRIILISILIVFGSLTSFPGSVQNTGCDAHNFDTLSTVRADNIAESFEEDILILCLEEVQEPMAELSIEQFFGGNVSTESSGNQNIKKSDTQ